MKMDSNKSFRMRQITEDFSPMEGVGNMADAMLVFACGLIDGTVRPAPNPRFRIGRVHDRICFDLRYIVPNDLEGHKTHLN